MIQTFRSHEVLCLRTLLAQICVGSIALSVIASCRSDEAPIARGRGFTRIALIGVGKDHPTWPILQTSARQIAGRRGRLDIIALAPDTASPRAQQDLLNNIATEKAEAVCINPLDASALAPAITELVQRGIPVITFGSDVPNSNRNGYCGPLESDIGLEAARACDLLSKGSSSSIMLLDAGEDDEFYGARYNAFKAFLPASRGISILRDLNCHRNRGDALELVRAESRKYPRAAGWVLLDDWPLRVLAPGQRLVPEGCGIVLCNADPRYNNHLLDGRITAMIGYDFRETVQQALYAAVRLGTDSGRRGFAIGVSVPAETITKQNLPFWEARWSAWQTGQPPPTTWPAQP